MRQKCKKVLALPQKRLSKMTVLEREVASNLGLLVALRLGLKPATPVKHLLQDARKVYSCAASRLERWMMAMDGEYLMQIVIWRFSRSFNELKTSILNDLDTGFESLRFLMQVAPRFMSEMVNSALQQVACDYLWTKTIIEKAFRLWPLAAGRNSDKRLFREVLIQLYKYVTKSLITWLTQHGPSIPAGSPALAELAKVIELLLKSVQCIAHHGSLSKTHKRLSFAGLFSGRALVSSQAATNDSDDCNNFKKKFSVKSQRRLESAFVQQMKYLRRDIGQRKNSVKCARWLALAVPREVQNEPTLLRADSLASISPINASVPFTPQLPQRAAAARRGNAMAIATSNGKINEQEHRIRCK